MQCNIFEDMSFDFDMEILSKYTGHALGALGIASAGFFGSKSFIKWYTERKEEQRKQNAVQNMINTQRVYEEQNDILEKTLFRHSMIFALTNGGGKLGPDSEMKIYCRHEVPRNGFDSEKHLYDGVKVDAEQVNMVHSLIQGDGQILVLTKNLPNGSVNKKRLIEKDVKCFFIYLIDIIAEKDNNRDKEEIHFGILNSKYHPDEINGDYPSIASQRTETQLNQFVTNIRKHYAGISD